MNISCPHCHSLAVRKNGSIHNLEKRWQATRTPNFNFSTERIRMLQCRGQVSEEVGFPFGPGIVCFF